MSNYILIGASGGIGSQLTEYLQGKGHSILLAQHKSPINKEALVQTLTHISSVEATDFESVHNLFSYGIKKLGNIDGIINLAGSILLKPAHKTTNKEFDHTINQNLKSSFSVVRAAGLLLNNASVVLMSSAAASIGFKNHEAIAAAKQLTLRVPYMQIDEAFSWTSKLSAELFKGEEAQEGMRAYLEKRSPSWIKEQSD